jgi:hypothetical protein
MKHFRPGTARGGGTFERFTFFDAQLIERLFRAEVLRLLMDRGLISQEVVDNLLSWCHSGFSVHADVKVADRQGLLLGRTADADLREWLEILQSYPITRLLRFLTSPSARAARLRQSSPFYPVLTDRERQQLRGTRGPTT